MLQLAWRFLTKKSRSSLSIAVSAWSIKRILLQVNAQYVNLMVCKVRLSKSMKRLWFESSDLPPGRGNAEQRGRSSMLCCGRWWILGLGRSFSALSCFWNISNVRQNWGWSTCLRWNLISSRSCSRGAWFLPPAISAYLSSSCSIMCWKISNVSSLTFLARPWGLHGEEFKL